MESGTCNNCGVETYPLATFCHKCGQRLKCESCGAFLVKDANNCISCGVKITDLSNSNTSTTTKNTITYRKTNGETFFDASLTDNVAKDGISGLIANITNNRLPEGKFSDEEVKDSQNNTDKDDTNTLNIDSEEIIDEVANKNIIDEFPHISDVEMTVECSEPEWIAIYAFYESNFAKKTFTKKAVTEKYMAKRKSDSRAGNFSTNWKSLFKQYFSTVNENEFRFKLNSIENISNIITGVTKGTVKNYSKKKKVKKGEEGLEGNEQTKEQIHPKPKAGSNNSYKLITNLDLHPKNAESLKDFHSKYVSKNVAETILLIVYYLQFERKESKVDTNKIYTCYKELGIIVPVIKTALDNINKRNGYLNSSDRTDITVTLAGENHIEHKMEKVKK